VVETVKKPLKWLIFGGTGQVGTELVTLLENRNSHYLKPNSKDLDIARADDVHGFISKLRPDIVINAAAWTDVDACEKSSTAAFQINALGPKAIAEACRGVEAKFFQISTDYVFSGDANWPLEINDPKVPRSVYGQTKSAGEDFVLAGFPDGSFIFRTAWLYSQTGNNFAKKMVRAALVNNSERPVVDDQLGQPTSAKDLANLIIESVDKNLKPGIYHATNSGQGSWNEFAREVFHLVGEDSSRVIQVKSSEFMSLAPRPNYSVLSHSCWENTGIAPMRDWREALANQIVEIRESVIKEGLA
jgi:dTDP-4-dehydrorhamnose reductase